MPMNDSLNDSNTMEDFGERAGSMIAGFLPSELLDASSGDAEATYRECRCIWADAAGIVKIDSLLRDGTTVVTEVVRLVAGVNQFRNVIKLYQYVDAISTAGTATAIDSSAAEIVNAIKLRW